jgi:predicted GNAT family acetyltransferase
MADVSDNPAENRFEIAVDGHRVGFAQYVRRPGRLILVHTEIDPEFGGRGLAGELATGALDAARADGALVVPLCPYVESFITKHPAYDDLVDHEMQQRLAVQPG